MGFQEVLLVNGYWCHYSEHNDNSTSTLFIEKQRSAQHGPRRAYGWDSIWLAKWLLTRKHSRPQICLFIGRHNWNGILVMMYEVLSHHICHLPEVWDDTFDVMYWATPVVKKHQLTFPGLWLQSWVVYLAITNLTMDAPVVTGAKRLTTIFTITHIPLTYFST